MGSVRSLHECILKKPARIHSKSTVKLLSTVPVFKSDYYS